VHEEWTDKLSDYLDGELTDEEQRAVDAHVRGCAECADVLNDLKRVIAQAQGVAARPRPPAADLWAGIAARVERERPSADGGRVAAFVPRAPRRVTLTLPQLAAAAALVAAVSGGIVWTYVERSTGTSRADGATNAGGTAIATTLEPEPSGERSAASPDATERVVPVGMADAQFDAAVSDLEKALKQGRGRLDAATISIVEHNLQIIDQAIDQAREALSADPANTYLSGHLVEARRRKLDLLRRAAALSDTD
jgi:anti-sigma factor RsiW